MATASYNIRLDEDLKKRAFPILESYGLTPAQAIKLFLNQVAETKSVPLSFDYHSDNKPSNRVFNYDLERMKDRVENQEFVELPDSVKTGEDLKKWLEDIA